MQERNSRLAGSLMVFTGWRADAIVVVEGDGAQFVATPVIYGCAGLEDKITE
jgi:hypothetical protein